MKKDTKDRRISIASRVRGDLSKANFTVDLLLKTFASKGLNRSDMVVLFGKKIFQNTLTVYFFVQGCKNQIKFNRSIIQCFWAKKKLDLERIFTRCSLTVNLRYSHVKQLPIMISTCFFTQSSHDSNRLFLLAQFFWLSRTVLTFWLWHNLG